MAGIGAMSGAITGGVPLPNMSQSLAGGLSGGVADTRIPWEHDLNLDYDFRSTHDKWMSDPAFRLDFFHRKESDKLKAENESKNLALDRTSVDLIKEHQRELEKHNTFITQQIAELQAELDRPTPQRRVPSTTLAQQAGVAAAALFGAKIPQVIEGADALSREQEAIRFDNEARTDEDRRKLLGHRLSLLENEALANRAAMNRLKDAEVESAMNAERQAATSAENAAERGWRSTEADKERKIKESEQTRKEKHDIALETSKSYEIQYKALKDLGGIVDPEVSQRLDLLVDQWNAIRAEAALSVLPYFMQGQTEQARHNQAQETLRQNTFEETKRQFDATNKRLTQADKDKVANWAAALAVRRSELAWREKFQGGSLEIQRQRNALSKAGHDEVGKAQRDLIAAEAALRAAQSSKTLTGKAKRSKIGGLEIEVASKRSRLESLQAVASQNDAELGTTAPQSGPDINAARAAYEVRKRMLGGNQEAINAYRDRFKSQFGVYPD